MIITIIATGSRGDVQPYIALGRGLIRAGHALRFVTSQNFAPQAAAYGFDVRAVAGDTEAIAQSAEMRDRVEGGNFLRLMAEMSRAAKGAAVDLAGVALEASRGADLILGGLGGLYTGLAVAEKLDLRFIQAYVVPFTPTAEFPGVLAPVGLGRPGNRLTHHLTRQMVWQGFRAADELSRRQVLGLPPAPLAGPYNSRATRGLPVLCGISPAVVPPPADWGGAVRVTGYWTLDAGEWSPPPALAAFLDAGPAPVYVGFGSMSNRDPAATAALVIEALRRSGQRAVLLSGWGGLRQTDLPDSVLMIDGAPHEWLFPRMAAVVHHGGSGTTAAGLRAGVPSLVVPFFGDQPYWGRRVAELGVGPAPIPRKQLTAERLAAAIATAVSDAPLRQRAAELGARLRAEDGVTRAVEIVTGMDSTRIDAD